MALLLQVFEPEVDHDLWDTLLPLTFNDFISDTLVIDIVELSAKDTQALHGLEGPWRVDDILVRHAIGRHIQIDIEYRYLL